MYNLPPFCLKKEKKKIFSFYVLLASFLVRIDGEIRLAESTQTNNIPCPCLLVVHSHACMHLKSHEEETNVLRFAMLQKEDTSNTKKFMPFGGGTRLCPGSEIARLEASLFLHHLVLKYAWTPLIEDEWPMSFPYIEFKHGFQLAIRPLQPSNYVTPTINL